MRRMALATIGFAAGLALGLGRPKADASQPCRPTPRQFDRIVAASIDGRDAPDLAQWITEEGAAAEEHIGGIAHSLGFPTITTFRPESWIARDKGTTFTFRRALIRRETQ